MYLPFFSRAGGKAFQLMALVKYSVGSYQVPFFFSTLMVFLGSLWFYAMRFQPANPGRSLIPCIVAHLVKNLGVVVIKAAQGFVVGFV